MQPSIAGLRLAFGLKEPDLTAFLYEPLPRPELPTAAAAGAAGAEWVVRLCLTKRPLRVYGAG